MAKAKFRLFGGPNGSGKTYIFNKFREENIIHTEVYVNADRIEAGLKDKREFNFNAYRVKVSDEEFKQHITQSGLYSKVKDQSFIDHFEIKSGILKIGSAIKINSYHASFIASYLAEKLLETNQSFAFETVMSHISKVELLRLAATKGYKTYFYFIFADTISTNVARVQLRAMQGGHDVDEKTIKERAPKTFSFLPSAFMIADNAYVIDNSNEAVALLMKEDKCVKKASHFPEIVNKEVQEILTAIPDGFEIKALH